MKAPEYTKLEAANVTLHTVMGALSMKMPSSFVVAEDATKKAISQISEAIEERNKMCVALERILSGTRIDRENDTFLSWHDMKDVAAQALLDAGYTEGDE